MKKRILIIALLTVVAASSAFASFDGLTSVGVNYEFRDGEHMGGLSSLTFGYVNDCPVGYLISVNADFNLADKSMAIGMLVGPSYRYLLSNVPMSIDVAIGASLAGQYIGTETFDLGIGGYIGATYYLNNAIGGYIGATYYLNNAIALLIGCNLGYDMLGVDLDTGDVGFSGDFYVSPSLSIGIRY